MGGAAWLLCPAVAAVGLGSAGSKTSPEKLYCKRLSITVPYRFRCALVGALRLALVRFLTPEEISTRPLSCSSSLCVCSRISGAARRAELQEHTELPWVCWDPPVPGDTHTSLSSHC